MELSNYFLYKYKNGQFDRTAESKEKSESGKIIKVFDGDVTTYLYELSNWFDENNEANKQELLNAIVEAFFQDNTNNYGITGSFEIVEDEMCFYLDVPDLIDYTVVDENNDECYFQYIKKSEEALWLYHRDFIKDVKLQIEEECGEEYADVFEKYANMEGETIKKVYTIREIDIDSGFFTIANDSFTFEIQLPYTPDAQALFTDKYNYQNEVYKYENKKLDFELNKALEDIKKKYSNTELSLMSKLGNSKLVYDWVNYAKKACVAYDESIDALRYFVEGYAADYYNVMYFEEYDFDELEEHLDNASIQELNKLGKKKFRK